MKLSRLTLLPLICCGMVLLGGPAVVADPTVADHRAAEPAVSVAADSATVVARPHQSSDRGEGGAPPRTMVPPNDAAVPGQSRRANQWITRTVQQGMTLNCTVLGAPYTEPLGLSWVGYFGDPAAGRPKVGDVYYVKVGWGVTGFPCGSGGAYTHAEIAPPAGTSLAISGTNKVRCWYQSIHGGWQDFTNGADCPQSPQSGTAGGLAFDPVGGQGAWPTASGAAFEIWIPVRSSQPLNGIETADPCKACVTAGVWMIDGVDSPWAYPRQPVLVSGAASSSPVISYPAPSVRNLQYPSPDPGAPAGSAYGETVGWLFSQGTVGSGFIEIGATNSYGARWPFSITSAGDYEVKVGWNMTPDRTWHWRMCFTPTGGGRVCGANQTFRTPAAPDTTAPNTSILEKPSAFTNRRSANFAFGSNEDQVTFLCKLDDKPYAGCPLTTPDYRRLKDGRHTLRVAAKDGAGHVDTTPAVYTWTVDTDRPRTRLTSAPPTTTPKARARFRFRSNEPSSYRCKLDTRRWRACSSPTVYKGLSVGRHTFQVRATDRAKNTDATPARHSWRRRS